MAWIEVHQSLPSDKKTMRLKRLLGIDTAHAVGMLTMLWLWSLDNLPDGSLTQVDPCDVANVVGWPGDPDELMHALIESGFVDAGENGRAIHDWHDYVGKLVSRRRANAERMRRARASTDPPEPPPATRTYKERAQHVQSTCATRAPATVPYRTEPEVGGGSGGDENSVVDISRARKTAQTADEATAAVDGGEDDEDGGEGAVDQVLSTFSLAPTEHNRASIREKIRRYPALNVPDEAHNCLDWWRGRSTEPSSWLLALSRWLRDSDRDRVAGNRLRAPPAVSPDERQPEKFYDPDPEILSDLRRRYALMDARTTK